MGDAEDPLTVFKCPCTRYIISSTGLDNHLKSCFVLLDIVSADGYHSEDDTPVKYLDSPKPDTVVGKVFGVEIIEFRSPKVLLDRSLFTNKQEIPFQKNSQQISCSIPVRRRGRPRKIQNHEEEPPSLITKRTKLNVQQTQIQRRGRRRNLKVVEDGEPPSDSDFGNEEVLSDNSDYFPKQHGKKKRQRMKFADAQYKFKCSVCPCYKFNNKEKYKFHMENVHGESANQSKIQTCPICGRMINEKLMFQRHLKFHEAAEGLEVGFNLWESWPSKETEDGKVVPFTASCKYCIVPHSNHNSFLSHMKTEHPDKGRFFMIQCPYCEERYQFDSMKLFLVHMRELHSPEISGNKSSCPICGKFYETKYLSGHLGKMHQVKSDILVQDCHKCPITGCLAKISSRIQLKRHFITHLENNPYVCKVPGCGFKSDAVCHLKRHMRQHTGADLVQCSKCKVYFSKHRLIDSHQCIYDPKLLKRDANGFLRTKLGRSRYIDVPVPEGFSLNVELNESSMNINQIIKTDPVYLKVLNEDPEFEKAIFGEYATHWVKPKGEGLQTNSYRCDPCATLFFEKKVFAAHKKICQLNPEMKPSAGDKVGCPICGESFDNFEVLVNHAKGLHPYRVYTCQDCERMYSERAVLEKHLERHEKRYRCMRCHFRFASKPELIKHKINCTSKKECSKCGKVLVNFPTWRRHWKIMHGVVVQNEDYEGYTGPKSQVHRSSSAYSFRKEILATKAQFGCEPCATVFFDKNGLETHKKICVNTDPAENSGPGGFLKVGCPICGNSYENFALLVKHAECVHPLEVFKCEECKRLYSRRKTLYKHLLAFHRMKYRCSGCYRRFKSKSERATHILKCAAKKKCSKCGKSLSNWLTWRNHWQNVHGVTVQKEDYKADERQCESRSMSEGKRSGRNKKLEKIAFDLAAVAEDSEVIVKSETAEEDGSSEIRGNPGLEQPVDILVKEEEDEFKPVIVNYVGTEQEREFLL